MVFIVPPSREKFALDVNPNTTTLHQLKVAIQEINGMPVSNQRLFLSLSLGQNDSDLISNLGIQPFSTLTLHGTDDTIGATSSTVKEELVKEADSESESDDDDEAKARKEACEYFNDSESDVDDKIEKMFENDLILQSRLKRIAAEDEDQHFRVMFESELEKLSTELDRWYEQEYKKGLEEDKKFKEETLRQAEEARKAKAMEEQKAKRKAMKDANKKAKKAKLDMKAEESKAKEE